MFLLTIGDWSAFVSALTAVFTAGVAWWALFKKNHELIELTTKLVYQNDLLSRELMPRFKIEATSKENGSVTTYFIKLTNVGGDCVFTAVKFDKNDAYFQKSVSNNPVGTFLTLNQSVGFDLILTDNVGFDSITGKLIVAQKSINYTYRIFLDSMNLENKRVTGPFNDL